MNTTCPAPAATAATGPKTAAGKAISARNATTHGLFCRQTVLPHLGEDPAGYQKLLDTLHEQLRPRNLMERQYIELFADASWKMRRFARLEAQVWEEDILDEDARLTKLERLTRLQTSLRRQLDSAVRMLSQDVPNLFAHRTREDVLAGLHLTETQCAENPYREQDVERAIQANRHFPAPADDFTDGLDNTAPAPSAPPAADAPTEEDHPENCRNEPTRSASPLPSEGEGRRLAAGQRNGVDENKICQNEPAPNHPLPEGEVRGLAHSEGFLSEGPPLSRRAQRRRELQALEDLLNSGTLSEDKCRTRLMSEDIPGFRLESGGRIEIHK